MVWAYHSKFTQRIDLVSSRYTGFVVPGHAGGMRVAGWTHCFCSRYCQHHRLPDSTSGSSAAGSGIISLAVLIAAILGLMFSASRPWR